jgi:hypothetical protein
MTVEEHADSVPRASSETTFRFVMTLIVTTLMAVVTAYVLGYAMLAPERMGSTHNPAPTVQHARA